MTVDNHATPVSGVTSAGAPKIVQVDADGKLVISSAEITAIKAKTDLLPASPSSSMTCEFVEFLPTVADTGDLEAGTKVVTAASQPAVADYSAATFAIGQPSDARLVIKRLCARLGLTVSLITAPATLLNYVVSIDDPTGLVADNQLLTGSFNTATANLITEDIHAASKASLFALLNDGLNHTVYVFLWTNNIAGSVSVTLAQLQMGISTNNTGASSANAVELMRFTDANKKVSIAAATARFGSGNYAVSTWITPISGYSTLSSRRIQSMTPTPSPSFNFTSIQLFPISHAISLGGYGVSVSTDLTYINSVGVLVSST